MKTLLIAAIAVAATDVASAVKFLTGPEDWHQGLGFNTRSVDTPFIEKRQATPKRQDLPTRNPHIPNSKTVKIRYGPYSVPGARVPGGEGMVVNRPNPSVDKPCQTCYLLGMNAGLEYTDGRDANTDSLMWLHHMVMFNIGKGAWDATCTIFGAPHLIVGSMPQSSERFFSSGNERTTTFFNPPWANVTNLGYPIFPADRFGLIVDLMNMNMDARPAYLTIYYDYVDGHPAHFDEVKPVWLDAAQCGTSEVSGRTAGAKFDFSSPAWIANFEGEVLGLGGHLHDGGTHMEIIVDRKVVCTSVPTYGTDEEALARANIAKAGGIASARPGQVGASVAAPPPAAAKPAAAPAKAAAAPAAHSHSRRYPQAAPKGKGARPKAAPKAVGSPPPASPAGQQPANGGGHSHGGGGQHIIAMSICAENKSGRTDMPISPLDIKVLTKGQSWVLKAYYDYGKFPGMKNHNTGGQSTVMGISIVYAKTKTKRVG